MPSESTENPESVPTIAPNFSAANGLSTSSTNDEPSPSSELEGADPSTASEQMHLEFSGVYLLTAVSDDPTAIPDLQLEMGQTGLTLSKVDGSLVWATTWDDVLEIATPERSTMPDLSDGVVLEVTTRQHRIHRFVVPSAEPEALELSFERFAGQHGVLPARPDRAAPAIVAIAVVVATAAVITVLLLMAGHVIHV